MLAAIAEDEVEAFRPLLPVGYAHVAEAYRTAVASLTARDLTTHYTDGLTFFYDEFVPYLKARLCDLTGGAWSLADFEAYAAGSDVDLMTHIVEAIAARDTVTLYPGDWYGFLVGGTHDENMAWDVTAQGELACLCVPSVRNGQFDERMLQFLESARSCLLNLNLFPTLPAEERRQVAVQLRPLLERSLVSISFSRGFGLTASQLGVVLVHRDHPYRQRFHRQWQWLTYFANQIAARAFMAVSSGEMEAVNERRRAWVHAWLEHHGLPVVTSGSYYVKSFRIDSPVPASLAPLHRDDLIRLCFKPPQTE